MSEFEAEKDKLTVDLIRLRHAVSEMRECIVPRLNALEDEINALMPKKPEPQFPLDCSLETIRSWGKNTLSRKPHK